MSGIGADISEFTLQRLGRGDRNFVLLAIRPKSPLFRYPDDGECKTVEEFVTALNTLVVAHAYRVSSARPPQTVKNVISPNRSISHHAEVLFFGRWLLIDGKPGFRRVRGQPADEVLVLRTVAALAAECLSRDRAIKVAAQKSANVTELKAKRRKGKPITRTDLRNRWEAMYGERPDASAFKARINTAQRYMRSYLDILDQPEGAFNRSGPLKSLLINKTLRMSALK